MARILLVDDDPAILKIFQLLLTMDGHDVLATESGEEAVKIVEQEDVDVVLSDVRMSPMDGFEVLRRVREARPDMLVFMVSAFCSQASVEKASRMGAFKFIAKPPDPRDLIQSVNDALAGAGIKRD